MTGRLTVIDNQVNAGTGTVTMQATFANADEALWPGEFVRVELTVANAPQGRDGAGDRGDDGPERRLCLCHRRG